MPIPSLPPTAAAPVTAPATPPDKSGVKGRGRRRPRTAVGVALTLGLVATLLVGVWSHQRRQDTDSTSDATAGDSGSWVSGASGDGVLDGSFGTWRGTEVAISGTWNDNIESQASQWSVRKGFAYASWKKDLDVAVGGIYKDRGETWAAAAAGSYDERWRTALRNLATAWEGRPGTLYIRFAHEFNGDWYGWSVTDEETTDFRTAWARFRTLQQEVLPSSKLVFCPTSETASSLGLDWRKAFPPRDQVDILGVDYYNQYPQIRTAAEFASVGDRLDAVDAPRGLERYRQFAEEAGVPLALPEWSNNAGMGDSPAFVTSLHSWLAEHAGSGPGQVLYEIQFNAPGYDDKFRLFPGGGKQPEVAATYRRLW